MILDEITGWTGRFIIITFRLSQTTFSDALDWINVNILGLDSKVKCALLDNMLYKPKWNYMKYLHYKRELFFLCNSPYDSKKLSTNVTIPHYR